MTKTIEISENPRKNQQNGKSQFNQFSNKINETDKPVEKEKYTVIKNVS